MRCYDPISWSIFCPIILSIIVNTPSDLLVPVQSVKMTWFVDSRHIGPRYSHIPQRLTRILEPSTFNRTHTGQDFPSSYVAPPSSAVPRKRPRTWVNEHSVSRLQKTMKTSLRQMSQHRILFYTSNMIWNHVILFICKPSHFCQLLKMAELSLATLLRLKLIIILLFEVVQSYTSFTVKILIINNL